MIPEIRAYFFDLAAQVLAIGAVDTREEAEKLVFECASAIDGMPWNSVTADLLRWQVRLAMLRHAGMSNDPKMTVGDAMARLSERAAERRQREFEAEMREFEVRP